MVDVPEEFNESVATKGKVRESLESNAIEEQPAEVSSEEPTQVVYHQAHSVVKQEGGTKVQDVRNRGHSEVVGSTSDAAQVQSLTKRERRLYTLMAEPIPKLVSSYEPCPFEYMPSRFLALLPHPFRSACLLAASTLFDTVRSEDFLSETIQMGERAGNGSGKNEDEVTLAAPLLPKAAKVSMTQSVVNGFEFVQNLTSDEVLKMCRKRAGVTVTRSFSVFADPILEGNDYAAASCANTNIVPGSFIIASVNGSQSYLYKPPDDSVGGGGSADESEEKLGIPQEVVTVQTTTVSAPKHWFCLRIPKGGDSEVAFLTDITGKRITIQHESTTNIAPNPVRLKRKTESRRVAASTGKRR